MLIGSRSSSAVLLITLTENRGPTKDEDFETTVNKSLFQWSQTSSGRSGGKWWDAVLDEVLRELAVSPEYKKGNGELNFLKLATSLGVDLKTIKSSLDRMGFSSWLNLHQPICVSKSTARTGSVTTTGKHSIR